MTESSLQSQITCAGCGTAIADEQALPFRCPNATPGDNIDHVLATTVDAKESQFPESGSLNPFVRFRSLSHCWRFARRHGLSDSEWVGLVEEIDQQVAAVDGHGFEITPWQRQDSLARALALDLSNDGSVWVKDETRNVAGSHKARHLMGVAIHLAVVERMGLLPAGTCAARLAIASCGNAALAAAVVANAIGRRLDVFIPEWADRAVVQRLEALGASLVRCQRVAGGPTGDPCYHRFTEAVQEGAVPFTCQGSDNGLTLEGGKTLAWELVCQHRAAAGPSIDRIAIQVGGGALASATIQALGVAQAMGALAAMPVVHGVQTEGGHSLHRAWRRAVEGIWARAVAAGARAPSGDADAEVARWIQRLGAKVEIEEELRRAATHRSEYMWPVDNEPRSAASGILDDETYDWLVIVRAMIITGGWPVVVPESTIQEAREQGRKATGIDVDATGTAGLAGLFALRDQGLLNAEECSAVLFTGVQR